MAETDTVLVERDGPVTEMRGGLDVIASGETLAGTARFASGVGRHGAFGGDGKKA
jgi:enoyl-CoA hydratase